MILGLEVKRSGIPGAGCGLFVAKPNALWASSDQVLKNACISDASEDNAIVFKPGSHSMVVPYTGESLTQEEEFERQDSRDTFGRYLLAQGTRTAPTSLDSIRTSESVARQANHKKQSLTNANLKLLSNSMKNAVQDEFQNLPWIIATKNLRVGQEIFVNQGSSQHFSEDIMPDEIKPKRSLCK